MLTFIIPFLVGTIVGFLIRGKPSDTFAITTGKRAAWAIGVGLVGLLIGMPIGLAISSTTGPQIAGLVGTGLGLGVLNILSIENPTYKKWSDKNAFSWLIGGVVALGVGLIYFTNVQKNNPSANKSEPSQASEPFDPDVYLWEKGGVVPNNYLGITLGDSEQQVRYVLGEPTSRRDQGDTILLEYRGEDIGVWVTSGGVTQIACRGPNADSCPPLLGVSINDSEDAVKSTLGPTIAEELLEMGSDKAPFDNATVMKRITVGIDKNIYIYLEQQKVQLLMLTKTSKKIAAYDPEKPAYYELGWTQESTHSKEIGPWIKYSPPGTRYCRYSDGMIQRLFPPGIKPDAEKANPFCLGDSALQP